MAAFALATGIASSDWPAFRGPNGSGVAADDKAPVDLSVEKGLGWKVAVPGGISSPIVVRNRVFLTGSEGDNRIAVAFDSSTVRKSGGGRSRARTTSWRWRRIATRHHYVLGR